MLATILVALINALFTFFRRFVLPFPGLDINAIGIIIVALQGESILLGALLLVIAHAFLNLASTRYLYLALPAMIATGYLALVIPNVYLLLIVYHLILGAIAIVTASFSARHLLFAMVNLLVNLAGARLYLAVG